ncbi:MAG TPA: uroporphyrinogen decarboxylase family protein, partial [Chloroflexota bacterium]|nr:uroporphyrinogen decarboxylase family protein [Chloroflexota bacterium]
MRSRFSAREVDALSVRDSVFLRACRREPVERTPVWFMRQAGRSLPEYRALRKRYSFTELSHQPDLCAQVTLQPVSRLGVDAAILFADIMTPLMAIGVGVELVEHVGPVIAQPVRELHHLEAIRPLEPDQDIAFLSEAIHNIKSELADRTPLIGFGGAPFTLAAY